jgi:uncharacterized protein (TIGR02996 family)
MELTALLRAVLDDPEDLAVRRVYADALLDAGDPRGELIHVALATTPEATARAAQLLATHQAGWDAALGANVREVRYRHGLPARATLALDGDPPYLEALDRAPITSVTLSHEDEPTPAIAAAIAADPRTARIRRLDLVGTAWTPLLAVLLGGDWRGLRALELDDHDASADVVRLLAVAARGGRLPHLEHLAFAGDYSADLADAIAALVTAPFAPALRYLALPNCSLGEAAAIELAATPALANLVELDLAGGSYSTNQIGDAGLASLAASPHLDRLARLSLVFNGVTDDGLLALAASSHLPALSDLAINGTGVTGRGIAALAHAPRFAAMRALWAGGCSIGDDGAAALAASPYATGLRKLHLHGAKVGAAGARALATSPYLGALEYLRVDVADPAAAALLAARFPQALR